MGTLICLFLGLICWYKVWFNKGDTCLEMGVKGHFVFFEGFLGGFIVKY